jgi:hypothetical protein
MEKNDNNAHMRKCEIAKPQRKGQNKGGLRD